MALILIIKIQSFLETMANLEIKFAKELIDIREGNKH